MTVVFVVAMSAFNLIFIGYLNQSTRISGTSLLNQDLFQENLTYTGLASAEGLGMVDSSFGGEAKETRFIIIESDSLLNSGNPLSNILPTREGLIIYKIQKGDNLSRIAANFGISLNTILWANNDLKVNSLKPGQEIVILPVTGILHQVQEEETLESISAKYEVALQRILNANPVLVPAKLSAGATIIIPDSSPIRNNQSSLTKLPNLAGYFSIPTTGWNWGQLHNYNAVDIANACGTPIYAAAEGLVVEESSGGWGEGYGTYIVIEHPNGTKTKYGHNQKNLVSVGDYVLKGDQIGTIGNTGLTHGPTGCHLHFEVKGAKNPFSK
ncbi:MAG: M23 family metallopeptidase [bacterium]|nr:M23 family metallopeptidase [bacterium]